MHETLAEETLLIHWCNEWVGDDVIDEGGAHRSGVTDPVHLHRRWVGNENAGSRILGITGQIDQDIDAIREDAFGDRGIVDSRMSMKRSNAASRRFRISVPSSGPKE